MCREDLGFPNDQRSIYASVGVVPHRVRSKAFPGGPRDPASKLRVPASFRRCTEDLDASTDTGHVWSILSDFFDGAEA